MNWQIISSWSKLFYSFEQISQRSFLTKINVIQFFLLSGKTRRNVQKLQGTSCHFNFPIILYNTLGNSYKTGTRETWLLIGVQITSMNGEEQKKWYLPPNAVGVLSDFRVAKFGSRIQKCVWKVSRQRLCLTTNIFRLQSSNRILSKNRFRPS